MADRSPVIASLIGALAIDVVANVTRQADARSCDRSVRMDLINPIAILNPPGAGARRR